MDRNEESDEFDSAKAELFEAISHPIRIKILHALDEEPVGFAELRRRIGIESGGQLSFHLNKLRHLVKVSSDGNYTLTANGKEALWSANALQKATGTGHTESGRIPLRHKSWLNPILAIIAVVLIVLGGIGAYQQGEFSSQQREIASQNKLIGVIQGGLPFTNAQNATLVIGQPNFTAYQTQVSQSGLSVPNQPLFDSKGDLWVVDGWCSGYDCGGRVLEYVPPFSDGMRASLVIGQQNFTSSIGGIGWRPSVSDTRLGLPTGAAFDTSGDLWISDITGNRILEFKPPFSSGMAASIVIGRPNFTSYYGGRVQANTLNHPTKPVFDSFGNLWVLDSLNNRALEFKPPFRTNMNASLVLGQPNFESSLPSGAPNGLACSLGDIAIDPHNDVWVGDIKNNRLVEFEPPFINGMNASLIIGQQQLATDTRGIADWGAESLGWSVNFDHSGNLWVTFNQRLLAFKPPFVAGVRNFPSLEIGQANFTSFTWVANGGQRGLDGPSETGFDSVGNLWVADSTHSRVLEFQASTNAQASLQVGGPVPGLSQVQILAIGMAMIAAGGVLSIVLFRGRRG